MLLAHFGDDLILSRRLPQLFFIVPIWSQALRGLVCHYSTQLLEFNFTKEFVHNFFVLFDLSNDNITTKEDNNDHVHLRNPSQFTVSSAQFVSFQTGSLFLVGLHNSKLERCGICTNFSKTATW